MNKLIKSFKSFIFIILIIGFWMIISELGLINSYVLPTPRMVLDVFIKSLSTKEIIKDIAISLLRIFKGFSLAFIFAFIFGMLGYMFPKTKDYYNGIFQFFRNVPPLSLIPLLILWFGIKENTKIVIIFAASFFPIYLNIEKGFSGCDEKLIEVGKIFSYSPFKIFKNIVLPSAVPDILVGMRIGLGYSYRAIIGAEMIAASSGIGYYILFAQQMSRTDKVIVGIVVIGVLGLLTDKAFSILTKLLFKGQEKYDWN